ncbi:UxaA family hydrolase [Tundrisphaera sp. TA3]|uniref:UxaA family hydrolase n=1 Tax=Tundrisphaera sp. TA3 TaxID=3435775 RepID=UPI003EBE9186
MATAGDQKRAIVLRDGDDVAVAARPMPAGFAFDGGAGPVVVREPIAAGHKVAIRDVAPGEPVRKYGQVIGFAARAIAAGEWVHVHNLGADAFRRDHAFGSEPVAAPPEVAPRTFMGYLRPDGRVGTRNYVAVVSTVNCSASTSRAISDRFRDGAWREEFPNVDGVFAITHKGGCGIPTGGSDHLGLERVLAGFANHPNVAACVVVGLGCEVSQAGAFVESSDLRMRGQEKEKAPGRPRVLTIQDQGGIARTVEAAVEAVRALLPEANRCVRTEQPASKLCVALECGGSDGNSGVTANPALGFAADLVVASGGTAVLGETTEIYGAEHLLTRRAVSPEVGEKLVERIRWWEWYANVFGGDLNNNPSPGNKAGGLTTIYEKSLGALAKAGSSPLVDVVGFAESIRRPGLFFMDTPGFDPVCTTGLVASGANVLVFTTGRGSVLGLKPTPCIKLATNTPMYERMIDDMDMDAGTILDGESVEAVGRRLFDLILDVADGRRTRSEAAGIGEEEFAPWFIGPLL